MAPPPAHRRGWVFSACVEASYLRPDCVDASYLRQHTSQFSGRPLSVRSPRKRGSKRQPAGRSGAVNRFVGFGSLPQFIRLPSWTDRRAGKSSMGVPNVAHVPGNPPQVPPQFDAANAISGVPVRCSVAVRCRRGWEPPHDDEANAKPAWRPLTRTLCAGHDRPRCAELADPRLVCLALAISSHDIMEDTCGFRWVEL